MQADKLLHDYTDAINRDLLPGIHWMGLKQSYEKQDYAYPIEILQNLHQKFCEIYGTDTLDRSFDFVLVPAVIKPCQSDEILIGLVQLDTSSSGEHWDTCFLTPYGALSQSDPKLNDAQCQYLQTLIPYHYFYTVHFHGDIHVDWNQCPEAVREVLNSCHTNQQDGQQEGMNLQ